MSENKDNFKVCIKDGVTVCHKDGSSLLETLESHNVEVHYHCRSGFCGACRTRLIKGEVDYKTDPLAFISDDEILPCCCVPTSDIEVEIL